MSDAKTSQTVKTDVVLVGAGIMSATLGALLRLVEPNWSITMIERLDGAAAESSDPWNNAGTGHSALCELNYTPENADGSIDISKAVTVNEQFQVSRQFWSHALESGVLTDARSFINPVPHVSFVEGADRVEYLRKRRDALASNPLFATTEFINDNDEFARRLPFMAAQRTFAEPVALNWTTDGTDIDFGALSKQLIGYGVRNGTSVLFGHEVRNLSKNSDGTWTVKVRNRRTGLVRRIEAKFVFVGAGGDALPLLQKSGIAEAKGYGGFPVGGQFLRTSNASVTAGHRAKVYGFPPLGAPPMSAPHLDTRIINGKQWLLFGPFAGWSPKFLKQGHFLDLPLSVKPDNLASMVGVGLTQMSLVNYLIAQLLMSEADRVDALRVFAPSAQDADWELSVAGQRVQVIKPAKGKGGTLEFGTTVLSAADGSIAGLLGASPGASTAVPAMLEVMERCFADQYAQWQPKLKEMIPSLGTKLSENPALFDEVWSWGTKVLGLEAGADAGAQALTVGADAPSPAHGSDDPEPAGVV
ncbi:malate dehydrogenase (quinone) [Mycolicibacterium confluentis]|uniref:Probable malate:quinone oxidoreductase n=1 Tax=Mycolicibacterium confluentis TaxID=28047 RepID=A0A7I7XZ81_9MYCO|nr:malate dehydrogenase (quinone) [Mycolicibacterium confluentis]MCV7317679.1 malate dehydrogenase (quinone) [Mycolicibacterium confluentis]ORV28250.1 malate:quinone oxidoreductase [Mycolicibacterium confluentis]BBZ34273.1 putative malate:quinone oxidoreductase [Mycolicibacterium confluentis]